MQPPKGTTQARIELPAVPPFELKGPLTVPFKFAPKPKPDDKPASDKKPDGA